jgi:pimeloyl-ACP methyl ester carboxylesterase
MRRLKVVATMSLGLAALGACSAAPTATETAPAAATEAASIAPSEAPTPRVTPVVVATRLDEVLTLKDGRHIKARCVGEGSPTILLGVGGGNNLEEWPREFVNALGSQTTTCLYSRAGGFGSSAPAKTPVSMAAVTSDAFEVLELAHTKAGVDGPYIFVGWSLGGSVALADALARPDQTVGIAILDTDFPVDFLSVCKAEGRSRADCKQEYQGDIDAKFMEAQIAEAAHPLDIPAVLVTAMAYPDCVATPSATLSATIAGKTVVAGDCAGLATAIADKQIHDWKIELPAITQTRLNVDHDHLPGIAAPKIAELIGGILEKARAGM